MATIHNAQTSIEPPSGQRSEGFQRRSDTDGQKNTAGVATSNGASGSKRNVKTILEDPQWKRVKDMIKSLSKPERRAIKQLLKLPDTSPKVAEEAIRKLRPVVLPMPVNHLPPTYSMDMAKGITAPLCFDTKSTPDMEALRHRMISMALESGLNGGVADESVQLLICALDSHLESAISNTIFKVRSNRALGIPVSNDVCGLD